REIRSAVQARRLPETRGPRPDQGRREPVADRPHLRRRSRHHLSPAKARGGVMIKKREVVTHPPGLIQSLLEEMERNGVIIKAGMGRASTGELQPAYVPRIRQTLWQRKCDCRCLDRSIRNQALKSHRPSVF